MFDKIIAFFMAIIAFFSGLFGGNAKPTGEYKNVSYGSHERQVLDLYIPEDHGEEIGLILFIHGGAWIAGDKSGYGMDYLKSASKEGGCAAAAMNYRYISDSIHINDIMNDIASALSKIKELGKENGVNISKVLLTGSSAGAHLSLLYAYSRSEGSAIKPAAVVSFCGPTDLADKNFYISNDLGSPEQVSLLMSWACGKSFTPATIDSAKAELAAVSPISYVNSNTVPTVIAHGEKDTVVPFSNAVALNEKLGEYGVKHDFIAYPNSNHDLGSDPDCANAAYALLREYAVTFLK